MPQPHVRSRADTPGMFQAADRRVFATVAPVSVLLGVVRPDGVAVVADRAAIFAGEECAPGVPMLAPDRCQLFVTAADVAVGVAGHISAPTRRDVHEQPTPDLLVLADAAAASAHTMSATAAAIREVLNTHAATICAAYASDVPQASSQSPHVLTTAFIGGRVETGDVDRPWVSHMLEVALLSDGTVTCRPVIGAAAYGPPPAETHLKQWVEVVRDAATLAVALTDVGALVGSAHRAAPALVTADYTAQVLLTGPAARTHHPYTPPRPPRF